MALLCANARLQAGAGQRGAFAGPALAGQLGEAVRAAGRVRVDHQQPRRLPVAVSAHLCAGRGAAIL